MTGYAGAVTALRARQDCDWAQLEAFGTPALEAAARVDADVAAGHQVLPPPHDVFAAFELTPLTEVRAVILGQDPYPTRGNAHGLAFSVPPDRPIPASLKTIFRSLAADFGWALPANGDLRPWAKRGVLLLNTILTVREGAPHSHKKLGWNRFSESVVKAISARREHVVFLLWGGPAQAYAGLIDATRHGIVACAHPSPLNARKGGQHPFIDAHPFRAANDYLTSKGQEPIDWRT